MDRHHPVKERAGRESSTPRLSVFLIGSLIVPVFGIAWLLFFSRSPSHAQAPQPGDVERAQRHEPAPPHATDPIEVVTASQVTNEGLPIRDPGPQDSHHGPVHPHPITPKSLRIQHENELLGAMNDAMDLSDGAQLRKILNEYRQQYPEDPNDLQTGYEIIADCLEHPGPAASAAARRYYDEHRGSILRRFVARHCFEP